MLERLRRRGYWFAVAAVCGIVAGCRSGPVSPTPPPPPPPPMVGEWLGALLLTYVHPLRGTQVTEVCDHQWTITTQTGTRFAGTFRSIGGGARFPRPETCLESAPVAGSVSSSAAVSGLTFGLVIGASRDCVARSPAVFSGDTTGQSLKAQATDSIECLVDGRPAVVTRSLRLELFMRRP